MKQRFMPGSIAVVAISMLVTTLSSLAAEEVSYKADVYPIINDYCLSCHKPGGKGYNKSGLDMRTYQSLMTGTKFGSVIKPGDSYTSIFIQVIEGRVHPSLRMPYGMSGGLAKDKIELMRKWVQQGAKNN
jgi:Planctomycete cytochrome C